MSFKDIFEKIKNAFISLYQKAADYCRENRKQAIIIGSLILLILILLICLLAFAPKKSKKLPYAEKELELSETPLVPKGPEVQEDYSISRTPKDKWSEEEADKWFTIPSSNDINSLGKTNDGIISEILGAAP